MDFSFISRAVAAYLELGGNSSRTIKILWFEKLLWVSLDMGAGQWSVEIPLKIAKVIEGNN